MDEVKVHHLHVNYHYNYLHVILQVDVVYILQTVLMMFEAEKPVLCEKPMTTSVKMLPL